MFIDHPGLKLPFNFKFDVLDSNFYSTAALLSVGLDTSRISHMLFIYASWSFGISARLLRVQIMPVSTSLPTSWHLFYLFIWYKWLRPASNLNGSIKSSFLSRLWPISTSSFTPISPFLENCWLNFQVSRKFVRSAQAGQPSLVHLANRWVVKVNPLGDMGKYSLIFI